MSKAMDDFSCGVIPVWMGEDGVPQFLLVQHHAGHWAFPKGHPEKGESDLEAATRECLEETGLALRQVAEEHPIDELYTFTKRSGKRVNKTVRYFVAWVATQDATPQEEEIAELAWGDAEATRERITFKEGQRVLDEALKVLEQVHQVDQA